MELYFNVIDTFIEVAEKVISTILRKEIKQNREIRDPTGNYELRTKKNGCIVIMIRTP